MARTLLHTHGNYQHANHGKGRACQCCSSYHKPRFRQIARQQQRRVEEREWRALI